MTPRHGVVGTAKRAGGSEVHPESWSRKCASPTLAVSGWPFAKGSVPFWDGAFWVSLVEPSADDPSIRAYGTRLATQWAPKGQRAANFNEGPAIGTACGLAPLGRR